MTEVCPECGAPVPEGGSCRDNLHALLFIEAEMPGGPGGVAHFYAVATYGLQHPESMGYTVETYEGLRSAVTDMLAGTTGVPELRRRAAAGAKVAGRVTRRGDDPVPSSGVSAWPMAATDVLPGGVAEYGERVERWARSAVGAMEAAR